MSKHKGFSITSAERYSLALYELSNESNLLDQIEDQSLSVLTLINKSEDFLNLIKDPTTNQEDLLKVPLGKITEEGVSENIRVGVQYLEAWLIGNGCVPLYNLMEDAATAEIGRAQLWQWINHNAILDDGRAISMELYTSLLKDEIEKLKIQMGDELFESRKFKLAISLFSDMVLKNEFDDFLTLPAYKHI